MTTTTDSTPAPLLRAENLHLQFGGLAALSGVRFEIQPGEILALIGPNGAGKTSALNCLNGFYRPQRGHIYFDQRDLTRVPTHQIPHLGIARTFQNIALYTGMTALDNLRAAHSHETGNACQCALLRFRAS